MVEGQGKHRGPAAPSTGPIHRVPLPAAGRHQEDDLDPKAWPWVALVLVATVLAGAGGVAWGRASGYEAMRAETAAASSVFTPEPVEAKTVTVKPSPRPTKTVTAKPAPRPTKTVTAEPSPGPTVYRTATAAAKPAPTVTKTRQIRVCLRVDLDDYMEEIRCP